MNLMIYAVISEMTNQATEQILEKYYNQNNVLIYEMMEECKFEPKVKKDNIYDAVLMHDRKFRSINGYYSFPPVDEYLLQSMSIYEAEIYKMMDKYFPPIDNFNDRQRIYYNAVRFFNGIIEKNGINCFIIFGPPHQVFDYVIYCLCKTKNIKTVLMSRHPIIGWIYCFFDINEYIPFFKKNKTIKIDDLNEEFRSDYLLHIAKPMDGIRPYYMRSGSINEEVNYFSKRVKSFLKYPNVCRNIKIVSDLYKKFRKKEQFIRKNCTKPKFNEKYIYFALHFQPEASTSPGAGVFVNQQLAIMMLSYYIPDNVFIYVKEHPAQGLLGGKDENFYAEINELRNVRIIDTSVSSNDLENHCVATVTCTGTVAYESMFKRKPSILFGYYIYNYLPGVFTVRNNSDCKKAIKAILEGVIISEEDILEFMYNLQYMSYHAEYVPFFKDIMVEQGVTLENNNQTIFKMLCDAIGRIE